MWSPCCRQRQQRHHLRRHAGGGGERGAAAFERRDALLEHRDRRVGDARVDVAERLQVEQARRVIGAVEHERRRLVDRQRARAGRGVGNLAGVHGQRLEAGSAGRPCACGVAGSARRRRARDHAGVDAGPVEAAEEARVLDLDAAVHHDVEAGGCARCAAASSLSMPICIHSTSRRSRSPRRRSAGCPRCWRKQSTMSTGSVDRRAGRG